MIAGVIIWSIMGAGIISVMVWYFNTDIEKGNKNDEDFYK